MDKLAQLFELFNEIDTSKNRVYFHHKENPSIRVDVECRLLTFTLMQKAIEILIISLVKNDPLLLSTTSGPLSLTYDLDIDELELSYEPN